MGSNMKFFTFRFIRTRSREERKRDWDLEQQGWENYGE
jgi:hypothetical protein